MLHYGVKKNGGTTLLSPQYRSARSDMETVKTEWHPVDADATERPSADFIRAVAELLETSAEDILAEMGYVSPETFAEETVEV